MRRAELALIGAHLAAVGAVPDVDVVDHGDLAEVDLPPDRKGVRLSLVHPLSHTKIALH